MTTYYTFDLVCPRCGKEGQTTTENREPPPEENCGDCLMADATVVEFDIVRVAVTCIAAIIYMLLCVTVGSAQETYRNSNGQIVGRSVTNNAGTTFYNSVGQQTGRAVTNNVGTTFYNAKGQQTGGVRRSK